MLRLAISSCVILMPPLLVILGAVVCVKLFYTGEYESLICATLVLDWMFVGIGYLLWLIRHEVI